MAPIAIALVVSGPSHDATSSSREPSCSKLSRTAYGGRPVSRLIIFWVAPALHSASAYRLPAAVRTGTTSPLIGIEYSQTSGPLGRGTLAHRSATARRSGGRAAAASA